MAKLAAVLRAVDLESAYETLTRVARAPFSINTSLLGDAVRNRRETPSSLSAAERLMYLDMTTYLPDDVLVKVDRATMASGLEARAPLLDHRVAEFAWSLPSHMKVRGSTGKWILRKLLDRLMPGENFDRSKMGFAIPIGDWLTGPLRDWGTDLLRPERIRADGYFNPAVVSRKWSQHVSGRSNHQFELWTILMFNAWKDSIS